MEFGLFSLASRRRLGIALLMLWALTLGTLAFGAPALAQDLGVAELHIAGTRLVVEPVSQTVPFDTPTIIGTSLTGFDTGLGTLPPDLVVVGELIGPEINGSMRLETVPGEPFRIPRLRLKGDYTLQDIRLEQDGNLLAYAETREATVHVTRILISSVSATAMTQEEIRSYGLVIGDDSYQAFNLVFAVGLLDQPTREYIIPVVYELYGHGLADGEVEPRLSIPTGGHGGTVSSRFQPPTLAPFKIDLLPDQREAIEVPKGGCDLKKIPCRMENPPKPPMIGVILFPSDINLLHQFFSVVLTVQNGAPEGDVLAVRDLTAKARIPSGLRTAETDPPTPLGVPVPVRAPGPDGEVGTADDLNLLVAQASGEAEFLVEGLREGTHIVEFDLQGVLDGMPGGPRPIMGKAKGAVVVRDPTLGVNVTHPETVRAFEQYTLGITISNLGNGPVNDLSFNLPASGLAGVELAEGQEPSITVASLLPGESEVVEFEVIPQINGRVIASTAKSGSAINPTFDFEVGIRNGVALSPNSLVMPSIVHQLPKPLYRELISLIGLGHSLSTATPGGNPDSPRVDRQTIFHRVYRMTEAARMLSMGEQTFDVVSLLAAEWLGARGGGWEWDRMRRTTDRGFTTSLEMAELLEADSVDTLEVFERFSANTGFLGLQTVAAVGDGVQLELMSRTSGKRMFHHAAVGPVRDLPFADTLSFSDGDLGVISRPEEAGYRAVIRRESTGSFDLRILLPQATAGTSTVTLEWNGVTLGSSGSAWVDFDRVSQSVILEIDDNGDGLPDRTEVPVLGTQAPRPLEVITAFQNAKVDPSGHVVDVLFSADIDIESLGDSSRFTIPGKYSNGGLTPSERDLGSVGGSLLSYEGFNNPRIVRVVFTNPLSAILPEPTLTVDGVVDVLGREISNESLLVELNATDQAIQVFGKIIDPYGQPLPFADVYLEQWDLSGEGSKIRCLKHKNAYVQADAEGNYRFDYVRQTDCSTAFAISAESPHGPHKGRVEDRVRVVGAEEEVNVVMVGRGIVSGRVLYDDGTVPTGLQVFAFNPVFNKGRRAWIGEDGSYRMAEVAVGTVTLWAQDDQGNRVFQTIEVPVAGSQVDRDLVMLKRPDATIARLSGTITDFVTGEPEYDAYVALYVGGARINVTRTATDGSFDFGVVPTGPAEIEAFDGATGRRGTQLAFTIEPDEDKTVELQLRDDRGTIQGYVRRELEDGSVAPVADAVVWAEGTPFNTTTDENGHYVLEDVFPGTRRIHAADLQANEKTVTYATIAGGQTQQADLFFEHELVIQGGIHGQVLDEEDQPVAGATIHLSGGHWSTRWSYEAVTDGNGHFSIVGLEPGSYGVHAYKGLAGGIEFADVRFPGDYDSVVVRFKSGTIRGRTFVRDADNTIQGVRSHISYRVTRLVTAWGLVVVEPDFNYMQTDGDGYFEIPALHGPYELFFYNPFHDTGYRVVNGTLGYIEPDHQVEFKQNGSISGTIYKEDGVTPAPGASVKLRGGGFNNYDLVSNEEGRFTFEFIPPGRYHITATLDEGVTYRTERVYAQMRRHGAEMDIEVILQQRGRVEGWVLDAGGIAVPGAIVELRERGFPHRRLISNADENGQYSFDNVFEGDVTLRAKAPELGGLTGHEKAEITVEDEVVNAEITLEGAADVRGQVINPETGEPVPNARVSVYVNGWIRHFVDSTQTDSDGFYEIRGLKLRSYGVRVFDPATGRRGISPRFDLSFHEEVFDQDVTLEVRGTVQGHLYDPDAGNQGVPGATLQLHSRGIRWFKTYSSTDIDGFYTFEGIPEGEFSVTTFRNRRRASGEGEIEEEDQIFELDLYLERQGSLAARILAARTGPDDETETVLEHVTTKVWETASNEGLVGASDENPMIFDPLRPRAPHKLWAAEINGKRRVRYDFRLGLGEDRVKDLRMRSLGSVEVTTATSTNIPLSGVNVTLKNFFTYTHGVSATDVGHGQSKSQYGTSDADGKIFFPDVWEGRYDVRIHDPVSGLRGRGSGLLQWDGEERFLTVRLQPSGTVRGTILLSDGVTPAAGAIVALDAEERSWQVVYAEEDGTFEFTDIPLGSYKLIGQENAGPGTYELHSNLGADQEIDDHTVILDDEDPFVVSIDPPFDSRDVPRDTDIVITFSEPMRNCGSSCWDWVRLQQISSSARPGVNYIWSADMTQLTVRPTSQLKNSTGYKVVVSKSLKDLARRKLAWRVVSSLYTADTVPPKIVDIRPRNNAVQVPVESTIELTFSEPVDLDSLSGAFTVVDTTLGQNLTVTTLPSLDNRRVVLTPTSDFSTDRVIEVRVSGVADGSGNVMAPFVSSFVTPDVTLPIVQWQTPSAGQVFTSGDTIEVSADVTDNRGVESVIFRLGDWSKEMSAPPFEWSIPAPVMAQAGSVSIDAEATDIYGNVATSTLEIWVEPLDNAAPPQIFVGCPVDGDLVAPGLLQPVSFEVTDDLSIESAWLMIDGERVDEDNLVWVSEEAMTLDWTPDPEATPGQVFQATLEARDFAGNVTSIPLTFYAPTTEVLSGDQALTTGGDLALGAGTFTMDGQIAAGELTLLSGAFLSAEQGAGLSAASLRIQCGGKARLENVQLTGDVVVEKGGILGPHQLRHLDVVAQNITVEEGASVDGRGKGYEGENGYGSPLLTGPWGPAGRARPSRGGGSHGGRAVSTDGTGDAFDSVYVPHMGGGGGANGAHTYGANGGFGGGIVWLEAAATLTLDGLLDAGGRNGNGDPQSGAGAGGSVRVSAQRLEGTGTILATGGVSADSGGGGRVVISAPELLIDTATQVDVRGGLGANPWPNDDPRHAGPGTLLVETAGSVYGTLIVDGGELEEDRIEERASFLTTLGELTVTATQVQGTDLLLYTDSQHLEAWLGAFARPKNALGQDLGTFRVLEVDGGALLLDGASALGDIATVQGVYRFDRVEVRNAKLLAEDPIEADHLSFDAETLLNSDFDVVSLTIAPDSVIDTRGVIKAQTMTVGAGAILRPDDRLDLDLEVTGLLTIEAGALVHADGRGYEGGPGPEGEALRGLAPTGVEGSMAGGTHGGHGHAGNDDGESFGSIQFPDYGGGGGRSFRKSLNTHTFKGGRGGGVLRVLAGDIQLDGELRANGWRGEDWEYGGAGGSVMIETQSLSGAGFVKANGGNGDASAGGGGRVAVYVDQFSGFDPASQIIAFGGEDLGSNNGGHGDNKRAGAGTVFLFTPTSIFGDLIVDGGETTGLETGRTTLPDLSTWTIGLAEVDSDNAADLWIEPQETGSVFDVGVNGMWARIDGVDYRVLADTGERRRILLEGAAASVSVGQTVAGVHKFDSVIVKGSALLATDDHLETASLVASEGGEIDGPNIAPTSFSVPAGSTVEVEGSLQAQEIVVAGTLRTPLGTEQLTIRADRLVIEAGGRIDQSGRGYDGGPGPEGEALRGLAPNGVQGAMAGGTHGGFGDLGGDHGEPFGSVYRPQFSGGGARSFRKSLNTHTFKGGRGGGVVDIEVGELVIHGEIQSNGWKGEEQRYGGAGGTIFIDAESLDGNGLIKANGAEGGESAGGGGRVALYVDQLIAFDVGTQVLAFGGEDLSSDDGGSGAAGRGGAGTVFVFTQGSVYGDLRVDGDEPADGPGPDSTHLARFGQHVVGVAEADATTPANLWIEAQDPAALFDLGVEGMWARANGIDYRVIAEAGDRRRILLEGAAGAVQVGDEVSGVYKFDQVLVAGDAEIEAVDLIETGVFEASEDGKLDAPSQVGTSITVGAGARLLARQAIEAPTLTIEAGGELRGTEEETLRIVVDDLIVEAGGAISVDAKGYPGGDGSPWRGGVPEGVLGTLAGGTHGGNGRGADTSSETYGSIIRPRYAGSGAGFFDGSLWDDSTGGRGGGVIEIYAQTVTLDGELRANGGEGHKNRHGGAGGTVYVEAQTVSGAGSMKARGAGGTVSAGGGGRIALHVDDLQLDAGNQTWVDSSGDGGAGTVYVRTQSSTWGDLHIDGRDSVTPLAFTRLPAVGEHEIAAVTVDIDDPANLWVEVMDTKADPTLGVEGQIAMVQGVEYRILEDGARRHFLLEGAAGFVQPGMMIQGLHRFDDVYVKNGTVLRSADPITATTWHIDAGLNPEIAEIGAGGPNCGSGNLLLNPSAEEPMTPGPDGQIPGWVQVSGSWAEQTGSGLGVNAADGDQYLWPGQAPSAAAVSYELRQDIDLTPWAESIDAGAGHVFFAGTVISPYHDAGRFIIDYLDEAGVVLGDYNSGAYYEDQWLRVTDHHNVPVTARTARVRLRGWKAGYNGDWSVSAGFDAMRFHMLPEPTLSVLGGGEVDETAGSVSFDLSLGCPRPQAVEASYQTADVSTTAGSDYTAASGTVTFAPGETQKTVTVTIVDDALTEGNEIFDFQVSSSDITVGAPSTLTTVVDDELGGLTFELSDAYPGDGLYQGGEVTYSATLSYFGAANLQNARIHAVDSAELTVVPGSVTTSHGTVAQDEPLDIALGEVSSGANVTVTYRALLGSYPAADEVSTQLVLTADGIEDFASDDPATSAVFGDVTLTTISPAPADIQLTFTDSVEGRRSTLDVTFVDPSAGDSHTASIDWGDGSPLEFPAVTASVGGGSFSATHIYAEDGDHPARICVQDAAAHETCLDQALSVANAAPRSATVNFENWTSEYVVKPSGSAPQWVVDPAGQRVRQDIDSYPTIFYSEHEGFGQRWRGRIRGLGTDNGNIGWVIGFQPGDTTNPDADYLLVRWKKQNPNRGIRLFRMRGATTFPGLETAPEAELIASGNNWGGTAWHTNDYVLEIEATPQRVRMWIDGALEIDETAPAGDLFSPGRVGLHTSYQAGFISTSWTYGPGDAATGQPTPEKEIVDFHTWDKENLPTTATTTTTCQWTVQESWKVFQSKNCRPGVFFNPQDRSVVRVNGLMIFTADDDAGGMIFGYRPFAESEPGDTFLEATWGGSDPNNTTGLNLYSRSVQTTERTLLATAATRGSTPWTKNAGYQVTAEYSPTRFRMWIDGTLEFDIAAGAEPFPTGRWGFYASFQEGLRIRDFEEQVPVEVNEGDALPVLSVAFGDPGALDTHTATVDWADGSSLEAATVNTHSGQIEVVTPVHTYSDDFANYAEVCVTDDEGAETCFDMPILVHNQAPAVAIGSLSGTGTTYTLDGSTFTDAGHLDVHTVTVDWGDGSALESVTSTFAAGSGTIDAASHTYAGAGTFTATVCVSDDDGGSACDDTTFNVTASAAPADLIATLPGVAEGEWTTLTASFTDSDLADNHTATVDWGEGGGVEALTVTADSGGGSMTASHRYFVSGALTARVCVTDSYSNETCEDVPVTVANLSPILGSLDFREFTDEHVPTSTSGHVAPVWQVTGDGFEVNQDLNSYPSVFYGEHEAFGLRFRGRIRMNGSDNDNVGWVLGFEPGDTAAADADYLLMRWKKTTEGAPAGLKLFRIRGVADLTALDSDANAELLASGTTLGSTGWVASKDYIVDMEADADGIRLWIDGVLELDIDSPVADPFSAGRFGLFTYVQEGYQVHGWTMAPASTTATFIAPAVNYRVFDSWTAETFPATTLGSANWAVSSTGLSVLQTANSRPTVFYGDYELTGVRSEVMVKPESDDDYFGFVLGFDPGETTATDADYLLMTWKGASDSSNTGLHLYRVRGALVGPFSNLETDPNAERLGVGLVTGGTATWSVNSDYSFNFELWPDGVRIWRDGELEFDIAAPAAEPFSGGRLGLYAQAQEDVRFRRPQTWDALEVEEGTAMPEIAVAFGDAGRLDVHTATVDWGDGSALTSATVDAMGGAGSVSASGHVYTDNQNAEALFCVDDGDGGVGCYGLPVHVLNAVPVVEAGADLTVPGLTQDLSGATFTDAGAGDTHTATVDWGDGTVDPVTVSALVGTVDAQHVYAAAGTYTVTVCVADDDGGEGCDTATATVVDGSSQTSPEPDSASTASQAPRLELSLAAEWVDVDSDGVAGIDVARHSGSEDWIVEYRLTIANAGDSPAFLVSALAPIPAGGELITESLGDGLQVSESGDEVLLELERLDAGDRVEATYRVRILRAAEKPHTEQPHSEQPRAEKDEAVDDEIVSQALAAAYEVDTVVSDDPATPTLNDPTRIHRQRGENHCARRGFGDIDDWSKSVLGDAIEGAAILATDSGDEALMLMSQGHAEGRDGGFFAHRLVRGDFRVEVDLAVKDPAEAGAEGRACLLARHGLGAEGAMISACLVAGANQVELSARSVDQAPLGSFAVPVAGAGGVRLAIERRGEELVAALSSDGGMTWHEPRGAKIQATGALAAGDLELGVLVSSPDLREVLAEASGWRLCRPQDPDFERPGSEKPGSAKPGSASPPASGSRR